jgi:uncharacterized protein involved in cysteine biosynthesis
VSAIPFVTLLIASSVAMWTSLTGDVTNRIVNSAAMLTSLTNDVTNRIAGDVVEMVLVIPFVALLIVHNAVIMFYDKYCSRRNKECSQL